MVRPLTLPVFLPRLETVYSDSIRKAELEARLSYLKVSPDVQRGRVDDGVLPPMCLQRHLSQERPLRDGWAVKTAAGASVHYPEITAAAPLWRF